MRRPPRSTLFPTRRSSDLHSNLVPWQMLCEEKGARLRVIPMNDAGELLDRKSTRLNSSYANISYAVFCLKKKNERPSRPCGAGERPGTSRIRVEGIYTIRT